MNGRGGVRWAGTEGTGQAEGSGDARAFLLMPACALYEDVQRPEAPFSQLRPREKSPWVWEPTLLTLGLSMAFNAHVCTGRGQSSEALDSDLVGLLTQWVEREMILGPSEGVGGQSP